MSAFGSSWVQDVASASDGRNTLELVGGSAVSIDSPARHGVRVNSGGSTSTRHRLNLIAGAGISLSLTDDAGDDESDATIRLADGDYGDVSIGSSGATMTVDNDAITYAKIQPPASTNMVLGFGAGTPGDVKELAVGTGLKTTTTTIQANIVPGTNVVITTNGTALQINVPPPAPLVFPGVPVAVATGEVTDTHVDTTFRDVTPTVRSGSSLSLGAGTLVSGSVLKVEIIGYMEVEGDGITTLGDGFEPDLRLIFDGTSDYTITWKFNEPGTTGPYMGCTWTAEAVIVVASGGNPATVRQRSKATYEDGLGIQRPSTLVYGAGYAIQATGAASGDLNTTGANTVRLEYRANSSVMEEFRVTSLIIWHL